MAGEGLLGTPPLGPARRLGELATLDGGGEVADLMRGRGVDRGVFCPTGQEPVSDQSPQRRAALSEGDHPLGVVAGSRRPSATLRADQSVIRPSHTHLNVIAAVPHLLNTGAFRGDAGR